MDEPGSWHHVVNRGIAKRPLFEERGDIRYFLSCLAREVRRGRIEVHAYCVMTTHFHLLLRSPVGGLSETMRRVQNLHARRFNRIHQRDGSLVRGRFFSRPIHDDQDLRAVVAYIDANPVNARIVAHPEAYEFGSASIYLRGRGPRWLNRSWVEGLARSTAGGRLDPVIAYRATYELGTPRSIAELSDVVERRLKCWRPQRKRGSLLRALPQDQRRWMEWKIRLADGLGLAPPVCAPGAVLRAIERNAKEGGAWLVEDGLAARRGSLLVWIGLLRDLCGLTWREIGLLGQASVMQVRHLHGIHRRLLRENPAYSARCDTVCDTLLLPDNN